MPTATYIAGRQLTFPSIRIPSFNSLSHTLNNAITLSATSRQFVLLCLLWYMSSALSNNSAKAILITFKYPVTLTFIQFAFISGWCLLLALFQQLRGDKSTALFGATHGIHPPTFQIILTTLPLSLFQIGGHIFGSLATSQIPVSVVHTVKALSPLFTVLTYRFMFNVTYSSSTYLSLLPLTLGVMLACSFELSANVVGLFYALGSTIVFVSQNIFIKKLHFQQSSATDPLENSTGHTSVKGMFKPPEQKDKLDKLNILFYSSGMAFLLMIPLWLYNEGGNMVWRFLFGDEASTSGLMTFEESRSLIVLFVFNGTVHFGQNIIAFSLLSVASPVAYSIAGLVKRIFVIVISIIWFGQSTTLLQALGIIMTFVGLYMYDRAKMDVARGERKVDKIESQTYQEKHLLPLTTTDIKLSAPPTPDLASYMQSFSATSGAEADSQVGRRLSSEQTHGSPAFPNFSLGSIKDSPFGVQLGQPKFGKENGVPLVNGHTRRKYSGSFHGMVNGVQSKNVRLPLEDDVE